MKKCKACQKEIDDKAKKCPHCRTDQRNWFARHLILTGILGLFVLIIVISVAGSGGKKTGEQTTATETKTVSENKPIETETIAKVEEAVEDNGLAFTVTGVDNLSSLGNQFTRTDAQGIFYVITLKIENKSDSTKTIDSSMITLTDSQNRQYDRSVEGQTAKGLAQGKVDLFLQQVQPSLSVTGDIVFDIPKDATGLKLIVKGSLFGSGKKIDLGQ